jgi:pyroglutamyl-peptidase
MKISKVLLTGFTPFWGYQQNVSQMAVQRVSKARHYPFKTVECILPTSFRRAPQLLKETIIKLRPDIILSFGLLENISAFRFERIGLNINHAIQTDVDGYKPIHKYILDEGPIAYEVNLSYESLVKQLKEGGLPVEISYHAETFVCNHLIYTTMHLINTTELPILFGFIHLPRTPEDVSSLPLGTPCMPFETIIEGLDKVLNKLSSIHN